MRVWISGPLVQVLVVAAAASGCTAASADSSTAAAASAKIDPKADQLLRKMSTSLAGLNAFQFQADHALEVYTKANQKLQFIAQSRVSIQRPNKLRSDRIGAVADLSFFYDGKSMTVFGNRTKLYASTAAPDTLDAAIDFARDKIGVDAPAADMLYSDVYARLMDNAETGTYIADEPVGDVMCHHLAYHAHDVDWQIWIEDTPRALPCRYVITSTDEPTEPQYEVQFSNWNVTPTLAANTFQFTPPSDATKIEFLGDAKQKVQQKVQQKGGKP